MSDLLDRLVHLAQERGYEARPQRFFNQEWHLILLKDGKVQHVVIHDDWVSDQHWLDDPVVTD